MRCNVGEDEERLVLRVAGDEFDTLVGELHAVVLLVYYKVEGLGSLGHAFVVLLNVILLGFQKAGLYSRLAQQLYEGLVLGQCLVGAEE